MSQFSAETQAMIDTAFQSEDAALAATKEHDTAVQNLATAQQAEGSTSAVELQLHQKAIAKDLNVALPASATKRRK